MKMRLLAMLGVAFFILLLSGCKKDDETAPVLPPLETMVIDFSDFTDSKSDINSKTANNFAWSATTVGVWNLILSITLVTPVAAFQHAFANTPTCLGDKKWEWTYNVTILAANYAVRLTGEIRANDVKWETYITKTGVVAFSEFKWFEGTSDLDGNGGQWILYHSPLHQNPVLQIDWEKQNTQIGKIKYTYVRENNDNNQPDTFKNSYLEYGLQSGNYNAYFTAHAFNNNSSIFNDTYIEWSTTEHFGHIKAQHIYQNSDWHCWDENGQDIVCPN
jgi:hypothetical protein